MNENPGFGAVQIVGTADGSDSLYVPSLNEHYHSSFGALQESQYIFIGQGFERVAGTGDFTGPDALRILEVGFGTGLNALLTQAAAERSATRVHYTAVEPFPLGADIWQRLNHPHLTGSAGPSGPFETIHRAPWNQCAAISPHFILEKVRSPLQEFRADNGTYHLVYFDAFGPDVQPELWLPSVFEKMYACLLPGGVLVTYSVKGTVVRGLKSAGFRVEKVAGPPGKRHITRAIRPPQVFAPGGI